jgi:hypothetical protein
MIGDLIPGRECGECKVCCFIPPIDEPEIQKEPNALCCHRATTGCQIYEMRPTPCRTYFCGWRQLGFLDDAWRPDRSGVLIESGNAGTVGEQSIVFVLIGNPLRTVREPRFLELIRRMLRQKVPVFLALAGKRGQAKAALKVSAPKTGYPIAIPNGELRQKLEDALKQLSRHQFVRYVLEHTGNDVST